MRKRKLQTAIKQLATSATRAGVAIDEATAYVSASNARIKAMEAKHAEQERQKRQQAVDTARASVGLSGFDLSPKEEQRAKQYIDGEMTLEEFLGSKTP